MSASRDTPAADGAVEIRVRGRVQGVGFRPMVWRLARELDLFGDVRNDCEGVLIRVAGSSNALAILLQRLQRDAPPLARIDGIDRRPLTAPLAPGFRIIDSVGGKAHTDVAPDAMICAACAEEIIDPFQRRFRYAFTNCTHCGPRLSILRDIPYDRAATSMAPFPLCAPCRGEYENPADRRFHAEATACHACGPKARLVRLDGRAVAFDRYSMLDDVDALCTLLQQGHIVAVKGLGGYQLACDATNEAAVTRLRLAKRRDAKPFALMARDLAIIGRYSRPTDAELRQLTSPAGPIVLMTAAGETLPPAVAPGLATLGFMLPTTPLHLLMLRRFDRPAVMTSGNVSDEPQIIDDAEAMDRLRAIADFALVHDRAIARRVDDSVVRIVAGAPRLLRRSRGYAPASLALPEGFERAPEVLAMGGELKSTFCLVKDGKAILSQHIGDLENDATYADYRRGLDHYAALFDHDPLALAADPHPDYLSSKLARDRTRDGAMRLIEVQHHHAHLAACLADNARPLDAPPVLGIILDGLGWGEDGTLWGGEFLLGDYRQARRVAHLAAVAMPGGTVAIHEPWRNLYAHLARSIGWDALRQDHGALDAVRHLAGKPRALIDAMIARRINTPLSSSCGRLFDAVAAALDICRERQGHEGEAASRLEALVCARSLEDASLGYPFAILDRADSALPRIEPRPMWQALLADLAAGTPTPIMAARFHKGLAAALAAMAQHLAKLTPCRVVALSGGCFQNAVLLAETMSCLGAAGFTVLAHSQVPTNDGGLALGQAAIAAARLMETASPCA